MPDTSPPSDGASDASHDSGDDRNDQSSKTPASKDKECPYCHQHFTSSSLGRHLDQFLGKKKPDGIHNVEDIRKLRGGITRRTARNSKKDGNEANSARTTPAAQQHYHHDPESSYSNLNSLPPGESASIRLNSLNWQSTGVITDPTVLNPSIAGSNTRTTAPLPSQSPINNPKKRNFSTYADDTNPVNLTETARALELSLREVLDSLRAATKHASPPPSPFDFDIQSQAFPALVLRLLPTPPTLNQASPFSTLASTPISAPGPDQLVPIRNQITSKIDIWKWQALRLAQRTTTNIADEAAFLSRQSEQYATSALNHLNTCYENWMAHTPDIRDLLWHVELLRAFQTQKDRASDLEERMEQLQQEANHLQQQIEYLSKCQWPREMALWPPDRHIFSRKMAQELHLVNLRKNTPGHIDTVAREREGSDDIDDSVKTDDINTRGDKDKWDFEKLVSKWRTHVREDKQRRTPYIQSTEKSNASPATSAPSAGMHWIGEKGLRTTTPVQWIPNPPKESSEGVNGVNGSGTKTPDVEEEKRRRMRNAAGWKNISIISDFGGD